MGFARLASQQMPLTGEAPSASPAEELLRPAPADPAEEARRALRGRYVDARLLLTADPRPDLVEDSRLWKRLLALAYDADVNLCGALHGFRCCGTRITRRQDGRGWRLHWGGASEGGWRDEEDYNAAKARWLEPRRELVVGLLGKIRGGN